MNTKDLMIGDYVSDHGKIKKIKTLSEADTCDPVLLTPKILKDLGFEYSEDDYMWSNESTIIEVENYGPYRKGCSFHVDIDPMGSKNSFVGIIRYLHELQHASQLCGAEELVL